MKKIYILLLFAIFFLAAFVRFYKLSEYPVGFHVDEASLGYNAYSLLLTGKDENNHAFPLYINTFGDYRPTGYNYLAILPVKFFGLTVFATRFPGALFGSISVFAIFFLTYVLFEDILTALVASVLLSFAPWHIVLSRASAEAIVALFFILIGFAYTFLSVAKNKTIYVAAGGVLLLLSFFFYHTPRVFVPLLFLVYLIFYLLKFKPRVYLNHKRAIIITFLILSFASFVLIFGIKGGTGRFSQTNIFSFPETKLVLEEQLREDGVVGTPVFINRIFHNKIVDYSLTYIGNYLSYFSGDFLFIKGGLPIWYQVPNMGLIYLVELPFLFYGLFRLAASKNYFSKLPLIWLVISPVVAAITVDDVPNINRAIVLFPILEIITAYGFSVFVKKFSREKALAICVFVSAIFVANFFYFEHQYFVNAKVHRTWYRNNGFAALMSAIEKSYGSYDHILMAKTTGGYSLILFYTKFDPAEYQKLGSPKDKEYSGFGKFFFVPQDCLLSKKDKLYPSGSFIFVENGTCKDRTLKNIKKVQYIYREDGTKAYRILYGV